MTYDEAFRRVEASRRDDGSYPLVMLLTRSEYNTLRRDPEALQRIKYTNPPIPSSGPIPHHVLCSLLVPPNTPGWRLEAR